MNCKELLRRLTEYEDGLLPAEACRELESHLAECAECAALKLDLQDLARLCRECDAPRLPEAIRRRLEARLRG